MKNMKLFGFLLLASAILFLTACPPPESPGPGEITREVTALQLNPSGSVYLQAGEQLQLAVILTPVNANTGIAWSSSNPAVATVSSTGLVTAVAALGTPAVVSVMSTVNPTIKAEVTVLVATLIEPLAGFSLYNQPLDPPAVGNTEELPRIADGKIILVNAQGIERAALNNSTGLKGNTILYYNTPFANNCRIRARIRFTNPVDRATSRGVAMGAFAQTAPGEFGSATPLALMFERNAGTEGPLSVTAYYTKLAGGNGTGSPGISDDVIDEYIYEVTRDAANGFIFAVYVSKDNSLISSNTVPFAELVSDLHDAHDVYLGFTVGGATAEISNIKIWGNDLAGDPVFQTTEIEGSPVPVSGVTLTGPLVNNDISYEYQNSLTNAQADTIILTAAVRPNLADDKTVTWSSSDTNVATVAATGPDTAEVTVLDGGTVTITVTTNENGFAQDYRMNITTGFITVTGIDISGETEVMVGMSKRLTHSVAPTYATDQTVTWSSSDESIATVDPATGLVKGVAEGPVTITATANDGSNVTATHSMTVIPMVASIFKWIAGTSPDFAAVAGVPIIVDGKTIARGAGVVEGEATGLTLNNSRFNIGSATTNNILGTSSNVMVPDGEFDFTQKTKITIEYSAITGTGFNVYVNNNTVGQNNSVLGADSKLPVPTFEPAGGTAVYIIDPALFTTGTDSLAKAFIQLRADSATTINITSIIIEYDLGL